MNYLNSTHTTSAVRASWHTVCQQLYYTQQLLMQPHAFCVWLMSFNGI